MLLSPHLLRRMESLELRAARRTKSSARGERRSRARGQSVEFADYRNYTAGDDLRYLDWNVYGRLERLYLKLYEEERELPVRMILDGSESMNFGKPTKFEFARSLAAGIGYVALCGFDRVSVNVLPEEDLLKGGTARSKARMALRMVRGKKMSQTLLTQLDLLEAGGVADLNGACRKIAQESRQAGLAVVISDFLDPAGYEAGLSALASRGYEVQVIQVLSPEELNPDMFGDLRLVDSETGGIQEVTFGKYRLGAYRDMVGRFIQTLREYCRARGMGFLSVSSASPLETLLLKDLRQTGFWQ